MSSYIASYQDVLDAHERIRPHAHRTPVMSSRQLDERSATELFLKCENFQRVGAFKFRGACNALLWLREHDPSVRAVVTHSSGNHAQAIALAASIVGLEAHIVMPRNAPEVKRRAVEGYGGIIYQCEPNNAARETTAKEVLAATDGTFVPPYDHKHIIAGQGTASLELLQDVPDLDAVMTPVGGGGLLSGTSLTCKGLNERFHVFGAEPIAVDDAARSLASGERQPAVENPITAADGLLTNLGELTWPIIRDHVTSIITVDEKQIKDAMLFVWERMKIIIEPSSAVAIAAAGSQTYRELAAVHGIRKTGIVISGGNVDIAAVVA